MTSSDESTAAGESPVQAPGIKDPPTKFFGLLRSIGPGLIIAGSIVGSGELIATTSTGAQAGFSLLWLIIVGCVIKVFVQVELGRYTIVNGTTTISGLASLPGPKIGGAHPIVWFWFIMFIAIMGQLGGIVGGVGQALSISAPLTERGRSYNLYREAETSLTVLRAEWESPETKAERKALLAGKIIPLQTRAIENYLKLEVSRLSKKQKRQLGALNNRLAKLATAKKGTDDYRIYTELLPQVELADWVAAEIRLEKASRKNRKLRDDSRVAFQQALKREGIHAEELLSNYLESRSFPRGGYQNRYLDELLFDWVAAEIRLVNDSLKERTDRNDSRDAFLSIAREKEIDTSGFFNEYVKSLTVQRARNRLDANLWTVIITVITIILLVRGRYGFIQKFSTFLVGLFTLVTIVNVLGLQTVSTASAWSITIADLREGLSFGLPEGDWMKSLAIALATFGIIGVGAAELIAYPYWCMEHGYARYTGPRDDSEQWAQRARGWMRVLRIDAWCSMILYTFATVAFYLLGAAILGRIHLVPQGDEMVRSLGVMYRPIFGPTAEILFLFGAFAVLYSTFFVATAGNARMASDVFRTLGFVNKSEQTYRKNIKLMCVILPAICATTSVLGLEPVVMVLLSGTMQAFMLPMVAAAAIYFRYKRSDPRVSPGVLWDIFLILSAVGMLIAGLYAVYSKLNPYFT